MITRFASFSNLPLLSADAIQLLKKIAEPLGLPMTGVVNFKFKSALAYDSVKFDGAFISVAELKRLIAEKKGLGADAGPELLLSDPRTKSEYSDETQLIPKNSSVVVRRTPAGRQQPTLVAADPLGLPAEGSGRPAGLYQTDELGGDLYSQQFSKPAARTGGTEDEALQAALDNTQEEWAAPRRCTGRGRGPGTRRMGVREAPPPHYICHRCHEPGHWIENCPTLDDPDFRPKLRPTGIPISMMAANEEGSLLLANGTTATLQPNEARFQREMAALKGQAGADEALAAVSAEGSQAPLPAAAASATGPASAAQPPPSAPPAAVPLLDNKPHQPPLSLPLDTLSAAEGPVLAGDTAMLPDSSALALPTGRFTGGLPPLPFPMASTRPFLPPLPAAEPKLELPSTVGREPPELVLQALSDRSGPMGPDEFALLQKALRTRQEGDRHK